MAINWTCTPETNPVINSSYDPTKSSCTCSVIKGSIQTHKEGTRQDIIGDGLQGKSTIGSDRTEQFLVLYVGTYQEIRGRICSPQGQNWTSNGNRNGSVTGDRVKIVSRTTSGKIYRSGMHSRWCIWAGPTPIHMVPQFAASSSMDYSRPNSLHPHCGSIPDQNLEQYTITNVDGLVVSKILRD